MASVALIIVIMLIVISYVSECALNAENTTTKRISITGLGDVLGVTGTGSINGDPVSVYKGIPYAEPPVGPLRFAKPQPKQPWLNGTALDAGEYGPICIQGLFGQGLYDAKVDAQLPRTDNESEDCLSLNVFVPDRAVASEGLLPVMVWIHGGGFIVGAGSNNDASVLVEVGRVLVVTFNYRVGVFGFFSTGDDASPGNYGLWDQQLAIIWVKDHIGSFGGDPNKITLFGFSAGGKGVGMQTATPTNSRSLFQRVITQSGSTDDSCVNSPETAALRSRQLGELLDCTSTKNSQALVDCARNVSAETLVQASNQIPVEFVDFSPFYPTIDGEFFPDYIPRVLDAGYLGQYDYLAGVNSDEGTLAQFAGNIPPSIDSDEELTVLLDELLVSSFCRCQNAREASEAVKFYYTSERGTGDGRLNRGAFLDAFADVLYTAPCLNNAQYHATANLTSRGSSYLYLFPYRAQDEPSLEPDILPGAGHGDEVPYVFGRHLRDSPGTEKGNLSALMISYWTNFARNGNPNENGVIPHWPQYDPENQTYAILQPEVDNAQRLQAGQVSLWLEYLPTMIKPTETNKCSLDVPMRGGSTGDSDHAHTIQVVSKDGEILGSVIGDVRVADSAVGGKEIAEFIGIPYADSPVGEMRFKSPKLALSWEGETLDLRGNVPSACPQDTTLDPWMVRRGISTTSEDCLSLDVYAPMEGHIVDPLPVVVFVHPGDLQSGTSAVYDAALLASKSGTVVVCVNYRLGALGFLSTEDEAAPGNYGLQDVLAALRWVNMFIGSFGGDPNRVTLVGHGAGAVLAHLLVLSEKSTGLFQRVVSLSGTALSPYLENQVQPMPLERAQALASKLGCPTEKSDAMIKCLRDRPAEDLVKNAPHIPFSFPFPIVVDGDVLKQSPTEILQSGNFQKVDYFFGMVQDEQAGLAADILLKEAQAKCPNETEVTHLIETVCRQSFPNPELVSQCFTAEYLNNGRHNPEDKQCPTRGYFRRFLHDYLTAAHTVQAAIHHASSGSPVFLFTFDHLTMDRYRAELPDWAGPAFGDDLQFLFGDPYSSRAHDELNLSYSLKDKKTTLQMMDFMLNFIHNGSPSCSGHALTWPNFEPSGLHYVSVDPCPEVRSGADEGWPHKLRFWSTVYATVTPPMPTLPPAATSPDPPLETCSIDSLGMDLSPAEAGTLIEALIGVSIAVFGILIIVVFVTCCCGGRRKTKPAGEKQGLEMNAEFHCKDSE